MGARQVGFILARPPGQIDGTAGHVIPISNPLLSRRNIRRRRKIPSL